MTCLRHSILPTLVFAFSAPAWADEAPDPQGEEQCLPTADVVETLGKFDSLKAKKRDTVGPDLSLTIELKPGEVMPERVELRDDGRVMPVRFNDTHRSIGLTDQLRDVSEAASLCIVDPARSDRTRDNRGYAISIGMGVRFKRTPGTHRLDELEDGMKDARSHYKKMAGVMGFMVPKFDHIAVASDDKQSPPRIWATKAGADIGEPAFELFQGGRMVAIDTLEDMGADGVRIEDGYYRMSPSPDAKTVAKFMGQD